MEFEDWAFEDLPDVEKRALALYEKEKDKIKEGAFDEDNPPEFQKYLTRYTNNFARATMDKWWELGDLFWGFFGKGF